MTPYTCGGARESEREREREREIEREGERDQINSKSDNNVRGSIMTYTATCY